jgi:hypothetical protein
MGVVLRATGVAYRAIGADGRAGRRPALEANLGAAVDLDLDPPGAGSNNQESNEALIHKEVPMQRSMYVLRLAVWPLAVAGVMLFAAAGDVAATDCNGKITYELRTKEDRGATMDYVFGVMVETDAGCGKVDFELHATERMRDGSERVARTRYTTKVKGNEMKARKIRYKVNKGNELISWEWVVAGCKVCGSVD